MIASVIACVAILLRKTFSLDFRRISSFIFLRLPTKRNFVLKIIVNRRYTLSPWLVKRSSGQKLHSFHAQTISYHSNYRFPSRRKKIPPSLLLWDTRDDSYDIRKSPRSWIYYYCYGSSKELGNCEIHTPAWIMPRHISLGNLHFASRRFSVGLNFSTSNPRLFYREI